MHLHVIQENYPFLKEPKNFLLLQLIVYVIHILPVLMKYVFIILMKLASVK